MMRPDLGGQIRELMERGQRPVSMTDIDDRSPVRITTMRRVAARSGPRRGRLILAGAAAAALCTAVAVAPVLPGGGPGSSTGPARLAAWAVVKQPDGSVMVTLNEIDDPARLQQTLRADRIPAKVFVNRQQVENSLDIPGCHVYPLGPPGGAPGGTPLAVWQRVFYGRHTNVRANTFWIYPSAIPHGQGVAIAIAYGPAKLVNGDYRPGVDLGYGVDSYSLYLVNATPECTGS
jgi:hypothetical protein